MSTVTALSNLAKDSIGSGLGTSAAPVLVAVIGVLMIAALTLFGQFGEVFARAIQLARIAINLFLTGLLLAGVAVVMAVVAVRA